VAPEEGVEKDQAWRAIRKDLADQGLEDVRMLMPAHQEGLAVWGHEMSFRGDVIQEKPISKGAVLEALESSQTVAL
jgi:hypothetical protein